VAAHLIGDQSTTFTCGLSVAPVATKAYYGQLLKYYDLTQRSSKLLGQTVDTFSILSNRPCLADLH